MKKKGNEKRSICFLFSCFLQVPGGEGKLLQYLHLICFLILMMRHFLLLLFPLFMLWNHSCRSVTPPESQLKRKQQRMNKLEIMLEMMEVMLTLFYFLLASIHLRCGLRAMAVITNKQEYVDFKWNSCCSR